MCLGYCLSMIDHLRRTVAATRHLFWCLAPIGLVPGSVRPVQHVFAAAVSHAAAAPPAPAFASISDASRRRSARCSLAVVSKVGDYRLALLYAGFLFVPAAVGRDVSCPSRAI